MRARRLLLPGLIAGIALAGCTKKHGRAHAFGVLLDPAGTVYTNGTVTFTVSASNGSLDTVELLEDSAHLATLTAPFSYQLDTTSLPEGSTQIVAQTHHGGKVVDSAPTTVVVDRTAPTVIALLPQTHGINFWSHDPAQVIFSEPLKSSTVFDGGVLVNYAAVGVTSGGAALDGASLQVSPSQELVEVHVGPLPQVPGQVTITFSSSITDRAGNPLTPPANPWTFTVPDWQAPNNLPQPEPGDPFAPASGVGVDDNPTVAYAIGKHVYAEHFDGVGWSELDPPQEVATSDAILAMAMRVGSAGEPVAAWIEDDAAIGQTVFVRRFGQNGWSGLGANGSAAAPAANACTDLALALDPAGEPEIAYTQLFTDADVRWNDFDGNAWGSPVTPAGSTAGVQDEPAIAVDSAGNAVVVWRDVDGLHAARRNGATFAALGGVIDGGAGAHPSVATKGGPVVAWDEGGDVHAARFDGASWVALGGALDATLAGTARSPAIEVAPDGEPTVAWLESDGAPFVVRSAHFDGSQWNALPVLTVDTSLDVTAASMVLDAKGAPFVTLTQSGAVYLRRLNGF